MLGGIGCSFLLSHLKRPFYSFFSHGHAYSTPGTALGATGFSACSIACELGQLRAFAHTHTLTTVTEPAGRLHEDAIRLLYYVATMNRRQTSCAVGGVGKEERALEGIRQDGRCEFVGQGRFDMKLCRGTADGPLPELVYKHGRLHRMPLLPSIALAMTLIAQHSPSF